MCKFFGNSFLTTNHITHGTEKEPQSRRQKVVWNFAEFWLGN